LLTPSNPNPHPFNHRNAIAKTPGCTVLDVDPGASTNRTVITFVGSPQSVVSGAFNAAKVAKSLINMATHKGAHPRFGAMDVCPFIPVRGATMDDCIECAKQLGKRMGEELGLPVYLYGDASEQAHRKALPDIRQKGLGEYEGVSQNITKPEWAPDFGPPSFVSSWGATAVGARMFLIAYNVNILGTTEQATKIAFNVREKGRGPTQPGRFKHVAGMGWFVDEYNLAQVSVNCTDFKVTNIHQVFESCKDDCREMGLAVVGSELVGLIPLECILDVAEYYIQKEGLFIVEEKQKVALAVERLGLNSVARFDPNERIIDYKCALQDPPLLSMTVKEFVTVLGARTAAPGGGSASALIAAMGTGLGSMMGWMTYGSAKWVDLDPKMRELIKPLYDATQKLMYRIDADTDAFTQFMVAMRMPKGSDEEKGKRLAAMEEGLKVAIDVPLETMRVADKCWDAMVELAGVGNINSKSDLQVGARALELGIWGCWKNVEINLKDIKDEEYKVRIAVEAKELWERADSKCKELLAVMDKRS
jgi:glutamate formiminotransferase/formiminotetrahydrofolate cyclodeaminase